ncbi:CRISPR-associated protein Cas4 [Natronobacterium gregoryi]|uniref:CRISPR-associated exonuclease Cas4 n=2 Tax=Natronobacterium gregoryi TaxID=44930 RepID=L0AM95_NATGS|nr:CRISPR-associated protein Cas4 [Natronobacterium gregoryi]AFZ74579.1 CRISPR-associated protein Cas4 [Natronobacterium gregoryi SP2]ELY72597.1 CRISPR-associated protein Cas4 [Natronobacterium gregoryi SP2]PLK21679.1 CRISPR-associated protein Cas4 [Natronobacterium gregoryi SP2]SFI94734.1 CRISPR-associated exonuclease Cas4 [Natronobacterium gregoryi]
MTDSGSESGSNPGTNADHDRDPVTRLLETARGNPVDDPFRVTGVMMQYYHVCKRELWFESRNLEIDRENPTIVRGTRVDDTAYSKKRRNISLGMIALDLLEDGRVVEVKPSSALTEPATMQLSYYLWYLERVAGIEKDGVLAHPRERNREPIELTDERTDKVEGAIRGISDVVSRETPPPAEKKPFCESCAYHDFCWC